MPYNYGNYYNNWNNQGMGTIPQVNYQQNYQQPQYSYGNGSQMQPQQPMPQSQLVVWVQGEAGAKAYPVAAGQSVFLMDSEEDVLYVKSTDFTGRPLPLEIYDLIKRNRVVETPQISQKMQNNDMAEYVKMSDLETKVNDMVTKAVSKAINRQE